MGKLLVTNQKDNKATLDNYNFLFWLVTGIILGGGFLVAGALLTPAKGFLMIVGLPICFLIFLKPEIGLYLTAFTIPFEKIGRFSGAESIAIVSIAKILGFLTLVAWIYQVLFKKKKVYFPREFLILILFWLVALTTLSHTSDFDHGMNRILSFLATFVFYFLIVNLVKSRHVLRVVLISLVVSTMMIGIFSIAQRFIPSFAIEVEGDVPLDEMGVVHDPSEQERIGEVVKRSGGTSGSPHVYSANLLVAIPLYIYFYRCSPTLLGKIALGGACALAILNLFLTHTRAAIIVLLLSLILIAFKGLIRMNPIKIIAIIVAILLALAFVPSSKYQRVLSSQSYTMGGSDSLQTRLSYFKSGIEMLKKYWLFGMGIGNFTELSKYNDIATPGFGMLHNIYLQMLNEVGIFGFSFLIFFLFLNWRNFGIAERVFAARSDYSMSLLGSALKISFISTLILGLSMDILHFAIKDWWMITALSVYLREEATGRDFKTP